LMMHLKNDINYLQEFKHVQTSFGHVYGFFYAL
jgi:hypothetical protein